MGRRLCGWFDWTYELGMEDGTRVHAYKHQTTRRSLHLAFPLRAFRLGVGGDFTEVPLQAAIVAAFAGWQRDQPSRSDVAALRLVLAGSGRTAFRGVRG